VGILLAEAVIKGYLVGDSATQMEMLDALKKEVASERGEFWNTVRESSGICASLVLLGR
jgi:hypothetical protein